MSLLFLPLAPTGAPQATPDELVLLDSTPDDVSIVFTGQGRTLPVTEGLDLTKLRVYGEENDGLFIELYAKDLRGTQAPGGPAFARVLYIVDFRLEGTQVGYTIRTPLPVLDPTADDPKGVHRIGSLLCVYFPSVRCVPQRVLSEVDWDNSFLRFWIPKASLLGRDPIDGSRPLDTISISAGSRLSAFLARSSNEAPFLSEDRLPNAGPQGVFVLQHPAANDRVEVRVTGGNTTNSLGSYYQLQILDVPRLVVAPGTATLLPILVENHNGGRRIIKLQAEILDGSKEAWQLRILNNLSVPGDQRRVVNLLVNASETLQHRDEAPIRVRSSSPGYPDEVGIARIRLVAAVTPDAEHEEVFLHARSAAASCPLACRGITVWTNTLPTDPRADSDDGSEFASTEGNSLETYHHNHAFLDTPLRSTLIFDTTQRAQAKLSFRSSVPVPGTVRVVLRAAEVVLARAETPYTGGPLTLDLTLAPHVQRVEPGKPLEFEFGIAFPGQNQPGALHQWIPKDTRLILPLLEDKSPKAVTKFPAGPALVSLALNGSDEQMGNPGKSRGFRFSLLNEGVEPDSVQLGVNVTTENWTAEVRPAQRYKLASGESVLVTLLVRAPRKAAEGERGIVILNATSGNDPRAKAQFTVSVVATEGTELPDDADNYTDDPEAVSLAERGPPKKSPAPGILVSALVVALAWLRRRATRTP